MRGWRRIERSRALPPSRLRSFFPGRGPHRERSRRAALAAAASLGQRSVTLVVMLLTVPLVLAALGRPQFGVWGATTSLVWLVALSDFGLGSALTTLIAQARALRAAELQRRYLTSALLLGIAVALAIASAGMVAARLAVAPGRLGPYEVAILGLALNVPFSLANYVWTALQKGWMASLSDAVQSLLAAGGLVLASLCTRDLTIFVAAIYVALLAANSTSLVWLLLRHPELRPGRSDLDLSAIRQVARTGLAYFVTTAVDVLSYLPDNLLALALLGPGRAAEMAIASRICMALVGVFGAATLPLWPAFVDAGATGDHPWILALLRRAGALLMAAALCSATAILVIGPGALHLWLGDDLVVDRTTLFAMALWVVALSLSRLQSLLLSALALTRFQTAVFAVATLTAYGLKLALAPVWGVAGILAGTALSFLLIVVPAFTWRIVAWHRRTGAAAATAIGKGA